MNSEKDYYQLYLKYKRKYLAEQKRQAGGSNTWYKLKLQTSNIWLIYETIPDKSPCVIKNSKEGVKIINIYTSKSDIRTTDEIVINNTIIILPDEMKKNYPASMILCVPTTATIISEPESIYDQPNAYPSPDELYGKIYSINAINPDEPRYTVKVIDGNCDKCDPINSCIAVKRITPLGVKNRDQFCITIKDFFDSQKRNAQEVNFKNK
jgi:hypothetical protein